VKAVLFEPLYNSVQSKDLTGFTKAKEVRWDRFVIKSDGKLT
jgi:hypothetical protein